jgi:hypothetical protein
VKRGEKGWNDGIEMNVDVNGNQIQSKKGEKG